MVLVSGILLAGALYTGADKEPSAETAAASAPVENVAASAEEPEVAIWEPNSSGSARQVPASEAASSARQSADAASADAEAAPAADMKAEEGAPVVLINDTLVDNGTEDRTDKPKAASAPRKPETQSSRMRRSVPKSAADGWPSSVPPPNVQSVRPPLRNNVPSAKPPNAVRRN